MQDTTNPPQAGEAPSAGPAVADAGRLLRLPAVLDLVGVGRSFWLDAVRLGRAPAPVRIGRATTWAEAEVRAWIAARIAERVRSHRLIR